MSNSFSTYLNFSHSAQEIDKRYGIEDHKERLILEAVLSAYADKIEFGVLDLVLMGTIASQATLHGVMRNLMAKKLIKTEVSKRDGRRKFVLPTKQGLAWLKDVTDLLVASRKR